MISLLSSFPELEFSLNDLNDVRWWAGAMFVSSRDNHSKV